MTLDELREMIRAGLVAKPIARRFRRQEARLERLVWKRAGESSGRL